MTAYLDIGRVMLAHLLTTHRRTWRCGVICGLLLLGSFGRTAGQEKVRAPDGVTAKAIMPEADPPFYPDRRIFVCSRATGLDPRNQVEHLPNHVQTLPEIHERFVEEFTLRPGFGMDRYHWQPGEWAELIAGESTKAPAELCATQLYRARDCLTNRGDDRRTYTVRPKYDREAETLTLPGKTLKDVVERLWILKDMHLIGLVKHKEPEVYLGDGNHKDQPKVGTNAITPARKLDSFEAAALTELRHGVELVARTTMNDMRILGAIRARGDCLACHQVDQGALPWGFHAVYARADVQCYRSGTSARRSYRPDSRGTRFDSGDRVHRRHDPSRPELAAAADIDGEPFRKQDQGCWT